MRRYPRALGPALFSVWLVSLMPGTAFALPLESRVPGGIARLTLGKITPGTPAPRAWLAEQAVWVAPDRGEWVAIVGIALDTPPGLQELRIDEGTAERVLRFEVMPKRYPEQRITLKDTSKVTLSPADETRALAEIAEIQALKRHWRESQETDGDLRLPAEGRISGLFGRRRVFNGEPRAPHSGLDLAIPRGTPIKAPAAGSILAATDYFFNGKTVFVDHGNGLITLMCHLDRIDVAPGERVVAGQTLGRTGMSGRASGPHLHWSVVLNGVMTDPVLFLDPARSPAHPSARR